MKETIEKEISKLRKSQENTLILISQFEKNARAEFKLRTLKGHLVLLENHTLFIGSTVYKYENSFRYSIGIETHDILNKINTNPIIFTKEMYLEFEQNLLKFYIERTEEALISGQIVAGGSCKFSNLVFEWGIQSKQDLIRLYREILTGVQNK